MVFKKKENGSKRKSAQEAEEARETDAFKLVHRYMLWSVGAGLIPMPWLDMAAVAGIQIKMVQGLSKLYEVEFSKTLVKSVIAALVGSITADTLRRSTFTSFVKSIPIVGVLGMVSMPIYSGATTFAIGKVFIQHFEAGGTFLDFDPQKVKEYFAQYYQEGQEVAADLKAESEK